MTTVDAPLSQRAARPVALSLYSGGGGLDYGIEAAGFRVAVATDFDHDSCETLRQNGSGAVIERSIFDLPTDELLAEGGLEAGEADLLIGGPPCQPFSKSGYWARGDTLRLLDPRADTLAAYLRVLEEARPRAFLFENVDAMEFAQKSEGLHFLLRAVEEVNGRAGTRYQPSVRVVNAADFGVPQTRKRLFVVAARDGTPFRFPQNLGEIVPGEQPRTASDGTTYYRSAWDALADVAPAQDEDLRLRGKWAALLPSIPEGHNYLWHTDRGGGLPLFGWRRRYWGFLLKLAKDRPAWTIQAQPGPAIGPFHWTSRRLSQRELCRLQTFPDRVEIVGNRQSVQRQLGNAVPSLLAEILGREIVAQLLGRPAPSDPPTLLPPRHEPVPPPEPVAEVPRQYQSLAGSHAPHPGTGRGPAAAAWRERHGQIAHTRT
ncbi:MAG: DNA cytosine methyltransferase [Chloroflexota bacterium]